MRSCLTSTRSSVASRARSCVASAPDTPFKPLRWSTKSHTRLVDIDRLTLASRTHFFAMAARLMRQILVDHARRKGAGKRGGGATMGGSPRIDSGPVVEHSRRARPRCRPDDLAELEARLSQVVELVGLRGPHDSDAAAALEVSRDHRARLGRRPSLAARSPLDIGQGRKSFRTHPATTNPA